MRISELISKKEILTWKTGDTIIISANTGAGKSYFIKNSLYEIAKIENKKILMLIHRSNCISQFKEEIKGIKDDVIDIRTYQNIETKKLYSNDYDINKYKFICCDEWHYFISDATFNTTTDISLNLILTQKNAIKIFMSATGNDVKKYLNDMKNIKTKNYELPIKYNFIENLTFFLNDESINSLANKFLAKGKKAIFFIQEVEKAYKLYKKFKDISLFNCSKNNAKYKYVDETKIMEMLKNQKFNEQFLITTSCFDSGVNIWDDNLKDIVLNIRDTGSMLQCIGRKRLQQNEKINIYVQTLNNQKLGGIKTTTTKRLKMAEYFRGHTLTEFLQEYPRQNDLANIIYDVQIDENSCEKKVNELMYYKGKLDLHEMDIIKSYGDFGYCKYLSDLFGIKYYRVFEKENETMKLKEYLNSLEGKKLDKNAQLELAEKIGLKDSRHRLQKSINQLSAYLLDNFDKNIMSKRIRENGKQITIWIIQDLDKIVCNFVE